MNGGQAKAERRNLRKAFGPEIEEALAELRAQVQGAVLQQRVLAKQMLEFETTVATVKQGRAFDQTRARELGARVDEGLEQLERLEALAGRRTHQLQHVDDRVHELEQWALARMALTRWQRLQSFVTGRCAVALRKPA